MTLGTQEDSAAGGTGLEVAQCAQRGSRRWKGSSVRTLLSHETNGHHVILRPVQAVTGTWKA